MYHMKNASESVKPRIRIERKIVRKVIADLLEAGYVLSVFDGEEEHHRSTDPMVLERHIMNTDEDYLFVWESASSPVRFGYVFFVYGNSGFDVISDHTMNLEEALKPAYDLAEKLEESARARGL